jgi:hypothetical protein
VAFAIAFAVAIGAFAIAAALTHGRVLFFPFFLILGVPLFRRRL